MDTEASMTLAEAVARHGEPSQPLTALHFNSPQSDQFCVNRRGQKLHLRIAMPPHSVASKAIVFFYHGYGAHVNGPTIREISEGMAANGYVLVLADAHGHGYSEGERVLVTDYRHLVYDCMQVIDIVTTNKEDGDTSYLGIEPSLRMAFTRMPFFLAGQSLGGALALLAGLRLRDDKAFGDISQRFLGVMTNCPAILGNPPPTAVVMFLKYLVVPLFPTAQLPRFLETVSVPDMIWTDPRHAELADLDKINLPGGLGWPGCMRIGTGAQLLELIEHLQSRLDEIDFPFLVLHDPKDGIVRYEGTEMLFNEATTSPDLFRGREIKEMLNLKHDLLANAPRQVLNLYLEWADARLSAFDKQLL